MKLRFTLVVLAALLLTAVAGASPAAPAVSSSAPVTAASAESEACGSNLSILNLAGLTPTPSPRAGGGPCGSCSRSPCQGGTIGDLCGFQNGQFGYCQSPLGNNCSDGITFKCQCWYGPLP